jgi:hypothetical protein
MQEHHGEDLSVHTERGALPFFPVASAVNTVDAALMDAASINHPVVLRCGNLATWQCGWPMGSRWTGKSWRNEHVPVQLVPFCGNPCDRLVCCQPVTSSLARGRTPVRHPRHRSADSSPDPDDAMVLPRTVGGCCTTLDPGIRNLGSTVVHCLENSLGMEKKAWTLKQYLLYLPYLLYLLYLLYLPRGPGGPGKTGNLSNA